MEKITFDEFYNKYNLRRNTIEHIAPYENTMFDFGDKELDYLQEQSNNYVWSLRDKNNNLVITSGLYVSDSIGYFVSKKPWINEVKYILK